MSYMVHWESGTATAYKNTLIEDMKYVLVHLEKYYINWDMGLLAIVYQYLVVHQQLFSDLAKEETERLSSDLHVGTHMLIYIIHKHTIHIRNMNSHIKHWVWFLI